MAEAQTPRRVVVADAAALVRLGVAAAVQPVGAVVVAETHSGRDAARLAALERADLLVLGATPDLAPAEVVRRVRRDATGCAHLVLMAPDAGRPELAPLLAARVEGLVSRWIGVDDLRRAVTRILKGDQVLAPGLLAGLPGSVTFEPVDNDVLSAREREVLALLAEGRSNREIADAMFVTLPTVKSHVAHIYAKLGVRNRNEALGRAIALGLLR